MFKSIIFDVYGTLISTGDASIHAVENILSKYDAGVTSEIFMANGLLLNNFIN